MKIDTQQIENPAVYDASYFIAKFEAIPDDQWITGTFKNEQGRCARGHCGETDADETKESDALCVLARRHLGFTAVAYINDGQITDRREEWEIAAVTPYLTQPTPKQRVLAWLRDAKKAGL